MLGLVARESQRGTLPGGLLVGAALSLSKAFTLYGARAGGLVFPWCSDGALQAALVAALGEAADAAAAARVARSFLQPLREALDGMS